MTATASLPRYRLPFSKLRDGGDNVQRIFFNFLALQFIFKNEYMKENMEKFVKKLRKLLEK